MTTMKAVRIHTYGGPEVLVYEDVPRPEPGTGEVLIRIHAAGVNPVDWKIREGYLKQFVNLELPVILGWDLSGVVEAIGSGVADFKVGDAVYTMIVMSGGAYAEYVALPSSILATKPASLEHIQAAAVPLTALTAWQALFDVAVLQPGQTILIHGAGGSVGGFAVQFAKWKGAQVIGTASAAKADYVRKLGADQVIDYTTQRFEQVVRDVDVVFDTIGGETRQRSWGTLRAGGVLVSTEAAFEPVVSPIEGIRGLPVFVDFKDSDQLQQITHLTDEGYIKVAVQETFSLAEAAKAHEAIHHSQAPGKIVLQVVS